ncbi:uncharacterized protein LOC144926933 [Branchiostoma floridae x Branchiostoma belcheri]
MSSRAVLLVVLVATLALQSDAFFFWQFMGGGGSDCGFRPYVHGTIATGCMWPYTHGETCYFRCWFGYVPVSGDQAIVARTCQEDGTWSGDSFTCRRVGFFGKK